MFRTNLNHGPINAHYMNKIFDVTYNALREHPRTFALRFDLHLPVNHDRDDVFSTRLDSAVISRFIDSLKARIKSDITKKKKQGKRVHPCSLRYIWVREYNPSDVNKDRWHYHVVIFLNKDTYAYPGQYQTPNPNLVTMIRHSWCSALGIPVGLGSSGVHIPNNPYYHLTTTEIGKMEAFHYRLSYLAKMAGKETHDGYRNFGCSQC
ncbi:Protein of uncharacterised function (DUF3296) [Yersinia intermedia]|uniref:inovirus Gp2 family protein n=1 Tax=Yersinia intermedia TaxID=631 RepID=UPI0005E2CA41|nr:inovirus Gp2 family protein [Yersinia intermedia]CNJ89820.1 Protein of uncharacterised function (DUF3296) [Yersinia intermedia]